MRNRKRSEKIFGIGLPRTGTTSLTEALKALGFSTKQNPKELKQRQFDGNFDFGSDWDALTNFGEHIYPQIDNRYPNSKFILTVRSKETWLKSIEFITPARRHKQIENESLIEVFGGYKFNREKFSYVYDLHYKNVMEYFRGREKDLLVVDFEAGDGWSKLCPFLNKDIPDSRFPHKNIQNVDCMLEKIDGEDVCKWVRLNR